MVAAGCINASCRVKVACDDPVGFVRLLLPYGLGNLLCGADDGDEATGYAAASPTRPC